MLQNKMVACFSLILMCVMNIKGMDAIVTTALHNLDNKGYGGGNAVIKNLKREIQHQQKISFECVLNLTPQELEFLKIAASHPGIFMEYKWDRPGIKVMQTVGGDNKTSFSVDYNIDFPALMGKVVSWPINEDLPELKNGFQYMWNMGIFFPTRHLTVDTLPLLDSPWDSNACQMINIQEYGVGLTLVDTILQRYTEHKNYIRSVINVALAMHITDDIEQKDQLSHLRGIPEYIKNLHNAICYQAAKDSTDIKTVYHGASMSSLGLFMMKMKRIFYLPIFLSASLDEEACHWDPFRKQDGSYVGTHNVKFVIDLSEYSKCATVIKDYQTNYLGEKEILLSCYNLYEYVSDHYDQQNETLYVYLKVKNSQEYTPEEWDFKCVRFIKNCRGIMVSAYNDIDAWMGKRGEVCRSAKMTSWQLLYNLGKLNESFNHNFEIDVKKKELISHEKGAEQKPLITGPIFNEKKISSYFNSFYAVMFNNQKKLCASAVMMIICLVTLCKYKF